MIRLFFALWWAEWREAFWIGVYKMLYPIAMGFYRVEVWVAQRYGVQIDSNFTLSRYVR